MNKELQGRLERLNKETEWYQYIDFGDGYVTPGVNPSSDSFRGLNKWKFLKKYLHDLHVDRVLDLGCSSGLYTLEAVKAGAKYALGLDRDPDSIRQAMFVRDIYNQHDPYCNYLRRTDFYIYDMTKGISKFGHFDVTFLFSCIYLLGKDNVRNLLRELRHISDKVIVQARYFGGANVQYPSSVQDICVELVDAGFKESVVINTVTPEGKIYRKPFIIAR